jgi:hypothetical protein
MNKHGASKIIDTFETYHSSVYADFRGLFTWLWPPFADSIYVGLPLFVAFRGLFTWFWPPFTDSVYVCSPLSVDFCGLFM